MKKDRPKKAKKKQIGHVSNLPAVIPPPNRDDWEQPSMDQIKAMTDAEREELLHDVSRRMSNETIAYRKHNAEYACTIGRILIVQKAKLDHGEWMPWVTKHTSFSHRQIDRWMHTAETWNARKSTSNLPTSVALDMSQRAFTLMNKRPKPEDEKTSPRKQREEKRKKKEESYGPHDLAEFIATLTSDLSYLRKLIQNPATEKQVEKLFPIIEELHQDWDSLRERRATPIVELPAPKKRGRK